MSVTVQYHVPRSQVWQGSRGGQSGKLHLHVDGEALCGKRPWYPRPADADDKKRHERCPRCVAKAEKHGFAWPE